MEKLFSMWNFTRMNDMSRNQWILAKVKTSQILLKLMKIENIDPVQRVMNALAEAISDAKARLILMEMTDRVDTQAYRELREKIRVWEQAWHGNR